MFGRIIYICSCGNRIQKTIGYNPDLRKIVTPAYKNIVSGNVSFFAMNQKIDGWF